MYERDKILWENKNNFLEETKDKNKKQSAETIKKLEATIENLQKMRLAEKNTYEANGSENYMKAEKKYWSTIQ